MGSAILVVFAVIFTGYILVKMGVLLSSDIQSLSRFVVKVAVPILLFRSFAAIELPAELPLRIWVSYFAPIVLLYPTAALLLWRNRTFADAVVLGKTTIFGNTLLIGVPLISLLLGEEGFRLLLLIIMLHGPVLLTSSFVVVELALKKTLHIRSILAALSKNPLLFAVVTGIALNLLFGTLQGPLIEWADIIARATSGVALLCVGGSLAGKMRGLPLCTKVLGLMLALTKLILLPLLVYVSSKYVFGLSGGDVRVLTVIAGLPTGVSPWQVAERFRLNSDMAGIVTAIATPLSMATLSVIMLLLR